MKWVLLVWIFTGDYNKVQELDFHLEQRCLDAKEWVLEKGRGPWVRNHQPKAECFLR